MATNDGIYASADAAAFALAYKNRLLLLMSSDILLGNTDVLPLDGTSSTVSYTTASAGSAGGNASGSDMPEAIAQIIKWQTGTRGRSHRGRSYLPGVRSNLLNDPRTNALTPTAVANLATYGLDFLNDLAALGHPQSMAILSIKLGIATQVHYAVGNPNAGIQRRRYEAVARH
jgi:hypothetical protein